MPLYGRCKEYSSEPIEILLRYCPFIVEIESIEAFESPEMFKILLSKDTFMPFFMG